MVKILVTNDDGIHSPGLYVLADAVRGFGDVYVVAPEKPKSATGLGMTLHKPLRVKRVPGKEKTFAISGTPSDIIHIATNVITGPVDLVVSGINVGDNTSIQVILSSGTIGAAAQAALLGIPAIAFSMAVSDGEEIEEQAEKVTQVIRSVVEHVLTFGLPEGVDVISVNLPGKITEKTDVKVVPAAKLRWRELVDERTDPMGEKYYWIYGEPTEIEPGTDVHVVFREGNIAITPLSLNINVPMNEGEGGRIREYMGALRANVAAVIRKMH